VAAINAAGVPVVACDIPSGIHATTGEVMGCAVKATHTVAFAAAKRGHYLLPGKAHTGSLHVVDIGIPASGAGAWLNTPALWKLPEPGFSEHKYSRGHALVMGGEMASTGAAKLAASAALKVGAGAVSVICDDETLPIYAASFMAVMTKTATTMDAFYKLIHEPRVRSLAIGMGAGVSEATSARAAAMLETRKPCVVDADALQPDLLPSMHENTVITPHVGEFTRLFGAHPHKMAAVEVALANYSGVLVYKGSDTVIAQRGRAVVINGNAPPTLATAGSGDVLAGLIAGLLAQGMKPFDAACAAVWLHGEAGNRLGRFFTAEDLIGAFSSLTGESIF
jgi:NAD(P)H-hydrate epimerase